MPRLPVSSTPTLKKRKSRNYTLIRGIERYGRSKMFHKTGGWINRDRKLWKKQPFVTCHSKILARQEAGKQARLLRRQRRRAAHEEFKKIFANKKEKRRQKKLALKRKADEGKSAEQRAKEKKERKEFRREKRAEARAKRAGGKLKKDEKLKKEEKPAATATPGQEAKKVKEDKKKRKKIPRAFEERKAKPRTKRPDRKLHAPHLRKSIKRGTVLILLSGRFKGRRVVFLKQLESGLLLVTGPYKVNGIPLRRVNQAYVIATSTRVPITFKIPKVFDDRYFRKPKIKKTKQKAEKKKDDFEKKKKKKEKNELPAKKKNIQKMFDKPILAEIKKTPYLKQYLETRFSLLDKQYPHLMKF